MAKKKQPTEEPSPYKTLFDHIDAIYTNQKRNYFSTLSDGDKKTYNAYMVNKFLSMNVHQLPLVNEVQKYQLTPDIQYLFYASVLPRGKQFNKFVKAAKEQKYEPWLMDLIRKVFEVSGQQAEEYLSLYYDKYPDKLRRLCEDYGVDPKLIKKAKL
jgi:hypothetical protein